MGGVMARPRKTATDDTSELDHAWISELAEALKPFAEHGKALRRTDPRGGARKELYEGGRNSVLRLGDFDRAVQAMEKLGHGN
jgi:hypothetical protein